MHSSLRPSLHSREPAFCVPHRLTTAFAFVERDTVRSLGQSLRGHVDFPRYYPRIFRKTRVGFTDMSRFELNGSLRSWASCWLTRQGISLDGLTRNYRANDLSLHRSVPACRHAVGTISLSDVSDVRRMVSEDSQLHISGFLAVHGLHDLHVLDESSDCRVPMIAHQLDASRETLEVALLRRSQRMPSEEWDHHTQKIRPPAHAVPVL